MDVKYEGTSFNAEFFGKLSEKDFISLCIGDGVYKTFSEKDRKEMLREVYKMIKNECRNI